jgi:UDPglucose 6-dehydrogenase
MKVTIIGTGYVGLTTGVSSPTWSSSRMPDVDENKINQLQKGQSPIYEPGLKELISLSKERLGFSISPEDSIRYSDVVFITVGTPSLPDGNPDLSFIRSAAQTVGKNLGRSFSVIVNKSTVPMVGGLILVRSAESQWGKG